MSSKVVGNYELTQKLGSGSYAQVYKCVHLKTGSFFAIKAISKEKVGDPKLMENLEQEISIMRDYLHENIVQLYEHFSSTRYIYLVLELCAGGDLSKYIRKKTRIEERVAHGFLKQIADGLQFLQKKNVIHRDLKPANILLTEFSDIAILKIADFGFAKHLVEASMAQTPCGSPLYMAPEIFDMQEYDAKADVWSVGCIFYEMLVGGPPFRGSNPRELFHNIRTKSLQVPAEVSVGRDSMEILQRILERNPRHRASLDQLCIACHRLSLRNSMSYVSTGPAPGAPTATGAGAGLPPPVPAGQSHSASVNTDAPTAGAVTASGVSGSVSAHTGANTSAAGGAGVGVKSQQNVIHEGVPVPLPPAAPHTHTQSTPSRGVAYDASQLDRPALTRRHTDIGSVGAANHPSPDTPIICSAFAQGAPIPTGKAPMAAGGGACAGGGARGAVQSVAHSPPGQSMKSSFLGMTISKAISIMVGSPKTSQKSTGSTVSTGAGVNAAGSASASAKSPGAQQQQQQGAPHPYRQPFSQPQSPAPGPGLAHVSTNVAPTSLAGSPVPVSQVNKALSSVSDHVIAANSTSDRNNNGSNGNGNGNGGEIDARRARSASEGESIGSAVGGIAAVSGGVEHGRLPLQGQQGVQGAVPVSGQVQRPPPLSAPQQQQQYQQQSSGDVKQMGQWSPGRGSADMKRDSGSVQNLGNSDEGFVIVDSNLPSGPGTPPSHPWRSSPVTVRGHSTAAQRPMASVPPDVATGQQPSDKSSGSQGQKPSENQINQGSLLGIAENTRDQTAAITEANPMSDQVIHPFQIQLQQQQTNLPLSSLHEPQSTRESEKAVASAAVTGLATRCEYVCKVVQAIVSVGDGMARDALKLERDTAGSPQKPRQRVNSNDGPFASFSGACALYLHCLALLRDSLQRVMAAKKSISIGSSNSNEEPQSPITNVSSHSTKTTSNNQDQFSFNPTENESTDGTADGNEKALSLLMQGLVALFDQIMSRVEHCHKRITSDKSAARAGAGGVGTGTVSGGITSSSPSGQDVSGVNMGTGMGVGQRAPSPLSPIGSPWSISGTPPVPSSIPHGQSSPLGKVVAEPLMYRAAMQLARDAGVDELLGNLQKACDDYSNAMLLIDGVMMTATEPADRATLQHLSQAFHGQHQHCQELLDSHAQILPTVSDLPTQPRPLHQYQHKYHQQQYQQNQRGGGAQVHQMSYSQPYVHTQASGSSSEMETAFGLGPQALYKVYPRAAINRRGSV